MDFQLNLDSETVDHAYPARPLIMEPQATIRAALRQMAAQRTGALLVCEHKRLLGVFTERDALRLLAQGTDLDAPLAHHMVADPETLPPNATVGQAVELMAEGGFRRLPIVNAEGVPTGLLKVSGIVRYMVEHFPKVVYTLPPSPHYKPKDRDGA